MALTKLTTDLKNIQALSDTPNATEGLTADELKALFDKGPTDIKTYINDTLTAEIDALITATKLAMNPIGSIVINITNTNPSTYIGGTWVAWGAGRVPVGVDSTQAEFDTVEETGGAKTQALTVANLPAMGFTTGHFAYSDSLWTGINITHVLETGKGTAGTNDEAARANVNAGSWHKYTWGSATAHNNLQPYITCYMFKRTA